jgi:TPP-dependent pyruvate/acetoin dehydrogenase alpha subunit
MRGLVHGTMHLSIGQEASAVGIGMPLGADDCITSTHRGHGHCIAKGAEPKYMFAEFFGKDTGYCKRPRRLHAHRRCGGRQSRRQRHRRRRHPDRGRRGMAAQADEERPRSCISFFGDGANNEGAFHEALNMAAIWKLPVVFVCENNKYGMSTSTERSTAVANVADRARRPTTCPAIVDGNNLSDVAEASHRRLNARARGEGPTLIECKTYRHRGHSKSDRNRYRTKEEIEDWIVERDPIVLFESELKQFGFD